MFFGYPIEAVAKNWLHDSLSEMIKTLSESLEKGESPPAWPDIIPTGHREELKTKTGLRDRWNSFVLKVQKLGKAKRRDFLRAFKDQNDIVGLLSGASDCQRAGDWPKGLQKVVKDLFTFAYELVRDGEIRKVAYEIIDKDRPQKVCPFCGYEPLSAPDLPKDALDHYLCKELYPFAAANLRNLVPIGHKCNSSYKLNVDVVKRIDGSFRRAFDPYQLTPPVLGSVIKTYRPEEQAIEWSLVFAPHSDELDTWLEVFKIENRFKKDLLYAYEEWIRAFGEWARSDIVNCGSVRQCLQAYAETYKPGDYTGQGFIRRPFFDQLLTLYDTDPDVRYALDFMVANG